MKARIEHKLFTSSLTVLTAFIAVAAQAAESPTPSSGAPGKKPNILILWGDDIGYWNLSAYNQGMMGYNTPNIDRIAKEGALFTDWYGQQSCTAGPVVFYNRSERLSYRHAEGRSARSEGGVAGTRRNHSGVTQGTRL